MFLITYGVMTFMLISVDVYEARSMTSSTWRCVLSGSLKLDIAPVADEVRYCLTPELYRVDPYPDDSGRPIKEIVEFPPREIFVPHNIYRSRTLYYFDLRSTVF